MRRRSCRRLGGCRNDGRAPRHGPGHGDHLRGAQAGSGEAHARRPPPLRSNGVGESRPAVRWNPLPVGGVAPRSRVRLEPNDRIISRREPWQRLRARPNRSPRSHQRPASSSPERSRRSARTRSLADLPAAERRRILLAEARHSVRERGLVWRLPANASTSLRNTKSRLPSFRARSLPDHTQRRTVSVDRPVSRAAALISSSSRTMSATPTFYYINVVVVEVKKGLPALRQRIGPPEVDYRIPSADSAGSHGRGTTFPPSILRRSPVEVRVRTLPGAAGSGRRR